MNLRVAGALAMLMCAPLREIAAQRLFGTVVLADERTPARGAIIVAVDTAGVAQARELANVRGEFVIPVSHPGRYTVTVLRVGSRQETVPNVVIDAGRDLRLRIVLTGDAPRPAPVTARTAEQCAINSDTSALGHAWSQFLVALATADIAADAGMFVGTWERRSVELWRNLRDTVSVKDTTERVPLETPVLSTIPADSSARAGFVIESPIGVLYNVPDIETLRSPDFMNRRCFAFVPPPASQPGWVGLQFRSTAFRIGHSNIEGTVWMDRATLEPRRLDFRYMNLPPSYATAEAGGTMRFRQLVTGHWVVDEWTLRFPSGALRRLFSYDSQGSPTGFASRLTLDGVHVVSMRLVDLEVNGSSILRRPE